MLRRILAAAGVLGLLLLVPVLLRERDVEDRADADPLVIISPHNEAIRFEFERAFRVWHQARTGRDVDIDWRTPGGTTEIVRHLTGEYTAAARLAWRQAGGAWTPETEAALLDRRLRQEQASPEAWAVRQAFLTSSTGIGIDLFFGGGQYDCQRLADMGILVPCGLRERHPDLFAGAEPLIPQARGGEIWYDPQDRYYGACLTAFGLCYNPDRLARLPGAPPPPRQWRDLGQPAYRGEIGLGDPAKSGSVAKAFEMLIQQEMAAAVAAGGEGEDEAARLARGWSEAFLLIRRLGANARYFTNAAGKVPMDVAAGDAAAGMCIDFYGRFQAEWDNAAAGREVLRYLTPPGGSSVSADPIGLLRGAPHPETARLFLDFLFLPEGQRLWNRRVGTPGGPTRYALRRLPIRRDLYSAAERSLMSDPDEDPFLLAAAFDYRPAWTGSLFNLIRLLIRVMVIDCQDELRRAWQAVCENGGPEAQPEAMARLAELPFAYADAAAANAHLRTNKDAVRVTREWADFFRARYREARAAVRPVPAP
jgi:ABC-type Fe3+ transport system substrate-binding protein